MLAVLALPLCGAAAAHGETAGAMPAGTYILDNKHTSVIFRINHLGFSHFTGRFNKSEGRCDFVPSAPENSGLDVTIDPRSIDTDDNDLDNALISENWFDTLKFPRATFHATHIERTGDTSAKITGDFTLHGVTHTLTLDTVLVGAGQDPLTHSNVLGFSATGSFKRSAYGIPNLEPMVGDEVTLQIDSEFDKEM